MPELPDIEVYLAALRQHIVGERLNQMKLISPFVLRSVAPKPPEMAGDEAAAVERLGKRIVIRFASGRWLVIHLMIAGRLRWGKPPGKISLAAWEFSSGTLVLTEASSKKRAGIWLGEGDLSAHDPGGLDPLGMSLEVFSEALAAENRTLKRALANPARFSGIGNAYSDEILHAARLSPLRLTRSLDPDESARLWEAIPATLILWRDRLLEEFDQGRKFPGAGDITAFRPDFAAHGKYGQPCPVCGKPIQRIVYAENETNYCAVCQNEGRLLADRALSRLLKDDWGKGWDPG